MTPPQDTGGLREKVARHLRGEFGNGRWLAAWSALDPDHRQAWFDHADTILTLIDDTPAPSQAGWRPIESAPRDGVGGIGGLDGLPESPSGDVGPNSPRSLVPQRIIVCGGRDFTDYTAIAGVLDGLHRHRPFEVVFHGGAPGADTLAERWAVEGGVKCFSCPAEWAKHGKRAGPIRNQRMLGNGIDLVVAFPGGRGTADMVRRARAAGVEVFEVRR